ncbi:hypothetical protein [Rubrivirga sp.]|uniref:hypothetical protein n=1 Tax=Rubrivirga sp. TaxID=1885344 RepID=UPI003B52C02C
MRSLALLSVFCLTLSACTTHPLLDADFEADRIGDRPNTSPPGPPPGDRIVTSDRSRPIAGLFEVVEYRDRQALRHRETDNLIGNFVYFTADRTHSRDQPLYAFWSGEPHLDADGSGYSVYLGDTHFSPFASVRLRAGRVLLSLLDAGAPGGYRYEDVGAYVEGRSHSMILTVDRGMRAFRLDYLGPPRSFSVTGRAVLNQSRLENTYTPILYGTFFEDTNGGDGYYLYDLVQINEREPEVPDE